MQNHIKNEYHEIWLEDDIIHGVYNPNLKVIDINIAKQLVNDRLKVSEGIRYPVLADIGNVKTITREAEKYMAAGDAMKYISAVAILTHSRVGKLISSIYISLSRPKIPTKVFADKQKAIEWLEQHKIERLS